ACDGSMRHGLEAGAWDRARRIAERALTGRVLGDIGNATHFHTIAVQPDWGPQMLRVAQVGLHVFYRFTPHAPLSRPASDDDAVLPSLPTTAGSNLRLATALLEKAADVTANASGLAPPPPATVAAARPVDPPAGVSKAADPAQPPRAAAAADVAAD